MNMQTKNSEAEAETPMEDKQEGGVEEPAQDGQDTGNTTPMDDAISMVDSYMKNPKLVTPETLGELKSMLEDMKPMLDGDQRDGMDEPTDEPNPQGDDSHGHGLTIMIGNMKKRGEGK